MNKPSYYLKEFGLTPGLRNPREHGSAAPRKRLRMAEKVRRILKKKKSSEKKEGTQNADSVS